jgi:hypothetical protein
MINDTETPLSNIMRLQRRAALIPLAADGVVAFDVLDSAVRFAETHFAC